MLDSELIIRLLISAPPLLMSLAVHEMAHARTALAFGDPTAKLMGRCTLNPLAHLDPIGTLALLFVGFGWAKPVPVNPANLTPRRLGHIAVSVAGPFSNLGLAVLAGLGLRAMISWGPGVEEYPWLDLVHYALLWTMLVNLVLFAFNLIPLFPLDGHHILRESLPTTDHRMAYMNWQMRYGRMLLLALILGPGVLRLATGKDDIVGPIGLFITHVGKPMMSRLLGVPF